MVTKAGRAFTEGVGERLDHYASRGAFRAFSRAPNAADGCAIWRARWHQDRAIEIVVNGRRQTITLKNILPGVDRKSDLDSNLRAYVAGQTGNSVPSHRRLAASREAVRVTNRSGNVSIALRAEPETDSQTLTDRAITLGHQIYTVFLREGGYDEYLVEALGVDLDSHM